MTVLSNADQTFTSQWQNFVTHLECSQTGETYPAHELHGLSKTGKPLLVRYDLAALGAAMAREDLTTRPGGMWRYSELLPLRSAENLISLGEIETPLIELGSNDGTVLVKDESRLPTGSFKARGLAMAVSMAKELGVTRMAMPTNGNAGAALAAYGQRAGIETFVFCPDDTPEINVREIALQGAQVWRVNGLIHHCGRLVGEGKTAMNWFDTSTLKEPYRIEGKKTMGLELAEQLGWQLPDVIFYPTGGGTGLIGMWKAFAELAELGWLENDKMPRMVAVQATGCAPIVKAFDDGATHAEEWLDAHTVAAGIRVPVAIGDFLILAALRESGGFAIAVEDSDIQAAQRDVAHSDGLLMGPEGAATYAAYVQALDRGLVNRDDRAVLFNCGTALKYPMPAADRSLDRHGNIDFTKLGN